MRSGGRDGRGPTVQARSVPRRRGPSSTKLEGPAADHKPLGAQLTVNARGRIALDPHLRADLDHVGIEPPRVHPKWWGQDALPRPTIVIDGDVDVRILPIDSPDHPIDRHRLRGIVAAPSMMRDRASTEADDT